MASAAPTYGRRTSVWGAAYQRHLLEATIEVLVRKADTGLLPILVGWPGCMNCLSQAVTDFGHYCLDMAAF